MFWITRSTGRDDTRTPKDGMASRAITPKGISEITIFSPKGITDQPTRLEVRVNIGDIIILND